MCLPILKVTTSMESIRVFNLAPLRTTSIVATCDCWTSATPDSENTISHNTRRLYWVHICSEPSPCMALINSAPNRRSFK